MPIPTNPPVLESPIGTSADVFAIPSQTDSGSGALSYRDGWPAITGISLKAGGLAPQREYFNAVNKLLSQHTFFQQSGGVYPWNPALDYIAGAHVLGSNGLEYVAVAPSGPDVSGTGAKDPTASGNSSYWLLLAARIMSAQGGLVVNPSTGQASVDFSQMSDSVLQKFLQQIKVPYWLEEDTNFYVNSETGSDTLDEGRGESEGKPFRTIQACLNHVASNFNLDKYNATIYVAEGVYERINLPSYSSSTGNIKIKGKDKYGVVIRSITNSSSVVYDFESFTIQESTAYTSTRGILSSSAGILNFYGVVIDGTNMPQETSKFYLLSGNSGSTFNVTATSSSTPMGLELKCNNENLAAAILLSTGANMSVSGDITFNGETSPESCGMIVQNLSVVRFSTSPLANPGRAPQCIDTNGTKNWKKYSVSTNSIINTGGRGPDFIPGVIAGTASTGGQYL